MPTKKNDNVVNARLDAFIMYNSFSCFPFWTKQYKKDSDDSNLVLWNLSGLEQERTSTTYEDEPMACPVAARTIYKHVLFVVE